MVIKKNNKLILEINNKIQIITVLLLTTLKMEKQKYDNNMKILKKKYYLIY